MKIKRIADATVGTGFDKYVIIVLGVNLLEPFNLLQNDIVHAMLIVAEYPLCFYTDFHLFRILSIYIKKRT